MPALKKYLLLKAFLIMAISTTADAQSSRKIGPVYIVKNTDSGEAAISVFETKINARFHYQLQLTEVKTATVINRNEILVAEKPINQEQIIGKLEGAFWILTDSLTGYDINTLGPVVTETDIVSINPFMKNNFSRMPNSYLLDEAAQVIYVGAENGDRYKLYPDIIMIPDTGSSYNAPENFSYEFAADYKLYGKYNMKYALSCIDTLDSRLFIVGSKKETGEVLSYFGVGVYPERDEMRQFTSIPFNVDGDRIDFSKNKPVTSPQQYFGAAFLLNKFYTTVWHGKNGEHIILYRSGPGTKATLSIAMLYNTGKEKWKFNTGVAYLNFSDYLITENSLLIWMDVWNKGMQVQQTFYISLKDGISFPEKSPADPLP